LRSAVRTVMQDASISFPEDVSINIGVFSSEERVHPQLSVRITHNGTQVLVPYGIREQTEDIVRRIAESIEQMH